MANKLKIFLVDGDDGMHDMLGKFLGVLNTPVAKYDLVAAKSLDEARSLYKSSQPDIVITGHLFPNPDGGRKIPNGIDVIQMVKDSGRRVKTIWSSGSEVKPRDDNYGADYSLTKPYTATQLTGILDKINLELASLGR